MPSMVTTKSQSIRSTGPTRNYLAHKVHRSISAAQETRSADCGTRWSTFQALSFGAIRRMSISHREWDKIGPEAARVGQDRSLSRAGGARSVPKPREWDKIGPEAARVGKERSLSRASGTR
eukprot:514890-Karenia_brevis.AAC.1